MIDTIRIIVDIVVILLPVICLYLCIRLLRSGHRSLRVVYFTFAVTTQLVCQIFWLVFETMRAGIRLPMAANEIGEAATYLLLATALATGFTRSRLIEYRRATILAVIFVLLNTGLWIAWSGEWLQDILSMIVLGYLLCVCIWGLKRTNALPPIGWQAARTIPFLIVLLLLGELLLPEPFKHYAAGTAYVLGFFGIFMITRSMFLCIRHSPNPEAPVYIACELFLCSLFCMYMSPEPVYFGFIVINGLAMFAMQRCIARQERLQNRSDA